MKKQTDPVTLTVNRIVHDLMKLGADLYALKLARQEWPSRIGRLEAERERTRIWLKKARIRDELESWVSNGRA